MFNEYAIQVQGLRKRFGNVQAVCGVSFGVPAGEIFGLLGLNGAGKAFASLGRLTPSARAMSGFQNTLIREPGLESAWLPTAILLAYALVFFAVAVWRFRKGI
jgi:ABC-type Mn2+/Zn2+ transport system ATPase subunit